MLGRKSDSQEVRQKEEASDMQGTEECKASGSQIFGKIQKNLASVLDSKKGAAALTRCKHEALGDGLLLFSRGKFIFNQVEGRLSLQTRPDLEGSS